MTANTESLSFDDRFSHLEAELSYARQLVRRCLEPESVSAQALEAMRVEIAARVARSDAAALPITALQGALGLNETERQVLLILTAFELDWEMARLCQFASEHAAPQGLSIGFLLEVLGHHFARRCESVALFGAGHPLRRHGLVALVPDDRESTMSIQHRSVTLSPRIRDFFLGHQSLDERLRPYAELTPCSVSDDAWVVEAETRQRLQTSLEVAITGERRLAIWGPMGCGKKLAARAVLQGSQEKLLCLRPAELVEEPRKLRAVLGLACLESVLSNAVLYLDLSTIDDPAAHAGTLALIGRCLQGVEQLVIVGARRPLPIFEGALVEVALPLPSAALREVLWQRSLVHSGAAAHSSDLAGLARQFPLSGGQIAAAVNEARRHASLGRRAIGDAELGAAAAGNLHCALEQLATRLTTTLAWDDLVLDPAVAQKLESVMAFARHRRQMLDAWGFGTRPGGHGLGVLFYGPPGTGKTMAARVIAAELGLELFRVDLSRLVSKWIGETEKNLGRVFDAAEHSHAVLLFDEADALFSKRTDVKSSNDRYANMEVNYLLQRMEQFSGISILTTNLASGLDEAFKRRLRFRVHFAFPEAALRGQLWQHLLPQAAPRARRIDWSLLGERFELSGGHILNALQRAAITAISRESEITFSDLYDAGVAECQEIGKVVRAH